MLTCGVSGMGPWGRRLPTATAALAQTYTYKWETFLTPGLPSYLAADQQVSTTGNGSNRVMSASSLETLAIKSNKDFQAAYGKAGGSNVSFHFPPAGNDAWPYWAARLQALKPDLIATING